LLEDIFEAEDALPPDVDLVDLPPEFFSSLTTESASPLLAVPVVRKLTSYILKVARPTKRIRQNTRDGSHIKPSSKGKGLADIETASLSRMLRMLERSVKAGEDSDPLVTAQSQPVAPPKSPSKKAKTKKTDERRSKSKTPHPDESIEIEEETRPEQVTSVDIQALLRSLEVAKDSVYAADCCLALLSSDRLTKQVRILTIGLNHMY
jgi:cohesin loading factor subunit SCC2